jgi:hypothetical protein
MASASGRPMTATHRSEHLRHDGGLLDLGIVAHKSKRKEEREQAKAGKARTRRGVGFFVRVLVVGTILVVVIALAGDDELRASLASWVRSADPWR